jgi:5-formyltetrahydrofolate cyclo-ligase
MAVAPVIDALQREKRELRKRMRALRLIADQKLGPDAAIAVTKHVLAGLGDLGAVPGCVVGGYWPIATELDDRPLLARLHERGFACALPCLGETDPPLVFRRWRPTDELEAGDRGTQQPFASSPEVAPEILLVPLLAVDRQGFRLGQGGGHFDRTLARLRSRGILTAVGVAYAIQRVERLPRDDRDQPLDWLVTEAGLIRLRQ